LAVYAKKQPKPHELGTQGGWNDWPDFDLENRNPVLAEKIDLGDIK
jgi:hypothetical protein